MCDYKNQAYKHQSNCDIAIPTCGYKNGDNEDLKHICSLIGSQGLVPLALLDLGLAGRLTFVSNVDRESTETHL